MSLNSYKCIYQSEKLFEQLPILTSMSFQMYKRTTVGISECSSTLIFQKSMIPLVCQ